MAVVAAASAARGQGQQSQRWQPPQEGGPRGLEDGDADAAAAWERVRVLETGLVARLERGGAGGGVGEEEVLEVLRACVEAGDDVSRL